MNRGARAPLLVLTQVSKWRGAMQVLRDVSLEVVAHERVVICGPSGSGKSTLLRCINGLEPFDAGRVVVDGTEVSAVPTVLERIRREVGMVFQSFNLFPHMTVLENCALAPIWVRRMPPHEARAIARDYLTRVRMESQAQKYPSQLSGGEQQRVAIARALCLTPKVMLFDEPTSALDPEMIREVLDIMIGLAESGMTMICVSHEMAFARRVADRVVFMGNGSIIEQGTPDQVFDQPRSDRLKSFLRQILHGGFPVPN